MHRTINVTDHQEDLNDLPEDVRDKTLEIANQYLAENESITPRRAIERAAPLAEQWYIDLAG